MTDTTKTEALRLADELDSGMLTRLAMPYEAAAELRRLYAERDRLAAECEALRAALSAILKSPTGCQFCDYGRPRLSLRTGSPCEHDKNCGFVLALAAMGGKESHVPAQGSGS